MKSSWHFSILLLIILYGCVNGEQTYKVDYTNLLCGGNSKVWELDLSKTTEFNSTDRYKWGQGLFVFYLSGKVLIGSLNDMNKQSFEYGDYHFDAANQRLSMKVNHETLEYSLSLDENGGIWLKKISGKSLKRFLHILPLREPT